MLVELVVAGLLGVDVFFDDPLPSELDEVFSLDGFLSLEDLSLEDLSLEVLSLDDLSLEEVSLDDLSLDDLSPAESVFADLFFAPGPRLSVL